MSWRELLLKILNKEVFMYESLDESFGKKLTEGFEMLAFEEDGFSNESYNGVSNYEFLDTKRTEIPLLKFMGSDPFIELLGFIDNIDNASNPKRALFMEESDKQLFLDQEDPEEEEESNPYVRTELPEALPDHFEFDLPEFPAPLPDDEN